MNREKLPTRRGHLLIEFDFAGIGHTAGFGFYENGRPSEVFIDCHKHGNAMAHNARDGAVLASLALQHGASIRTLHEAVNREANGEATGVVGAALDVLKDQHTELFVAEETAGAPQSMYPKFAAIDFSKIDRETLNKLAEQIRNSSADTVLEPGMKLDSSAELALLKQENEALHDQIAELQDSLQVVSDIRADQISFRRTKRQDDYLALAVSIWGDAAKDRDERWRRFAEECIEAIQTKFSWEQFLSLAHYVYERPVGEPQQELGGVQTTGLALCAVEGWNADELEVREIKRVQAKDPNVLRAKHQMKVEAGVAMQARRADPQEANDYLYGKSCEPTKLVNTGIPATGSFE